jgi:hypothetical protein
MAKKIKFLGLLLFLPIFTFILSGCGKTVSEMAGEKAAEKIIEDRTGGKAKVDVDNGNVKIETKEGSFETGKNIKLPADFPSDIYIIEDNLTSAMSNQADGGFTISLETAKSLEEVSSVYQEKLKAEGWNITGTMNYGDSSSVIAEKDNRVVSVFSSKNSGKTAVMIGVGKK